MVVKSAMPAAMALTATMALAADAAETSDGRIEVDGISYYYQSHGAGEPMLLLHGGLGSIEMFGPVLARLAKDRQVIAVDLQGHGRTTLGDRPLSYYAMGDDMAAILDTLALGPVDVMGYSLGGGIATRLAIQHPEAVDRLVVVSSGFATDGIYPEMLEMQATVGADIAPTMEGTPMKATHDALSPEPERFPELLDQLGDLMRDSFDWTDEVKTMEGPVMIVVADADMIRPDHAVAFFKLLGGGQRDGGWMREGMSRNRLAILPGRTHYDIFFQPILAEIVLPFLNGDDAGANWVAPTYD